MIGNWKVYKTGSYFREKRFFSKETAIKTAHKHIEQGSNVRVEKYACKAVLLNGRRKKVWDIIEDTKQVMGL